MRYQIQVRTTECDEWRPAIQGTLNGTDESDEDASTLSSELEAEVATSCDAIDEFLSSDLVIEWRIAEVAQPENQEANMSVMTANGPKRRHFLDCTAALAKADVAYADDDAEVEGPEYEARNAAVDALRAARAVLAKSDEPRMWTAKTLYFEESLVASSVESAVELAEEWAQRGWDDHDETFWVRVELFGEDGTRESLTVAVNPDAPKCVDGLDHDWQSPREVVGGCEENPGVHAHGGGVVTHEVCSRCSTHRKIDTWAQDPETGEQGLCSIRYEREGGEEGRE